MSTTTSTHVVREEMVSMCRAAVSGSTAHGPAASMRPSRLDVGRDSWPGRADEPTQRRPQDSNDDDDGPPSGEFQTDSSRWNEDADGAAARRPVVEGEQDVRFIDDDDDSELDQRELDGASSTTSVEATSDDDMAAASSTAVLGRRWGTVELLKPSPISPLPSPGAVPLKSIMKSPKTPTEVTLSTSKKGISFSQDTVFK